MLFRSRRNPGGPFRRAPDFAETGIYLTVVAGREFRVFRDGESRAWCWADAPENPYAPIRGFLGYSKAEALATLERRVGKGMMNNPDDFGRSCLAETMKEVPRRVTPETIRRAWAIRGSGYAEFHIPESPEFPEGFYYHDQDKSVAEIKAEGWEAALRKLESQP